MAMGEKRLLSLINATVSHEMRNPINSIHSQLLEMENINQRLQDIIDSIPVTALKGMLLSILASYK